MTEWRGWILDVYADQGRGAVVWIVTEDGKRLRLTQELPVTFYVGGDLQRIRALYAYLDGQRLPYKLTTRRHLFNGLIDVVAIPVLRGARQRSLFRRLHDRFPDLDYYNADIALPIHYFVTTRTFPMALCTLQADGTRILSIQTQEDKWSLRQRLPQLRIMEIEPSSPPGRTLPTCIRVSFAGRTESLFTKDPKRLLDRFGQLLSLYDPDILHTRYGDAWMFPYLFSIARANKIPFNPNRDQTRAPLQVEANQFESYGRLVHRDAQTLLFGRLHLDPQNSMAFDDWGVEGAFETARLSNLPIQNAARRSAGGSFVGMQITASLEKGILIPIRKEQRERFKSANQLIAADNGGVIFKPVSGLYANVAEIDFFSMYPHIMTGWNISAETVGDVGLATRLAPGIEVAINQDQPGIVTDILRPILAKRAAAKILLERGPLDGYDPHYLKTAYDFLKGLGWVSYGYQGFSGNRIGSIEAHEAINAVSREVILRAKEVAEDAGFTVLHVYVDSLFVTIDGHRGDVSKLLLEIEKRTGLRIDLEGVFRWIAFLPSKQNENIPVPNCYFGVFRDGRTKSRGIMSRRGDTPVLIHDMQEEAIRVLASEPDFKALRQKIPILVDFFKKFYRQMLRGEVSPASLVIKQTLSRNPEDFVVRSPAGAAAAQLAAAGRPLRAGQGVEFVRVTQTPHSLPWELFSEAHRSSLDRSWYSEQILRAAHEVLAPLGVSLEILRSWLAGDSTYWQPHDFVSATPNGLPLLESVRS